MSTTDELQQLTSRVAALPPSPYAHHMQTRLSLLAYLRIANDIARHLPCGRLLDWGAGYGQVATLLRRRGLELVAYDYTPDQLGVRIRRTALDHEIPLVTSDQPVELPFQDASFDAVLSCGVLEHVADEHASLEEIRRILRPGGQLLIYQLPQHTSYQEWLIRNFKLGYAHERRYNTADICMLLAAHGFIPVVVRRANMLPKNFTGLPGQLRALFDLAPNAVLAIDQTLAEIPGLNMLAGVLEVIARKR